MRKITEHSIIYNKDDVIFHREINTYIRNGWQPFGIPFQSSGYMGQAMVKYENKEHIWTTSNTDPIHAVCANCGVTGTSEMGNQPCLK